jgi:hypothetical protein
MLARVNSIDLVVRDELTGEYDLRLVVEPSEWSADRALDNLRLKLDSYFHYVRSGQMRDDYPDFTGPQFALFWSQAMRSPSLRES